ncbi:YdcF family protein [Rhodovulum adriaticum]|uniref:Uncharacterized SAM-binding protein YcdF (DUF218 family) n=1 Tax=Rhodovulum adriaticum TaxID=35804 RepID=A0A4R2P046_RHOAD|nr:YdcF family protein [Rhodovulum adriaticum]MBK1634195.1 hypothetical protein [Rhodovulum adriaticum]TCP27254.1 uncharacterized SAM-binding protein YcdF (DUF218 family) [Rhodovulum adriaticum]
MGTVAILLRQAVGIALSPVAWLLAGLALALVLVWRGRLRGARWLLAGLFAGLLAISLVPLGHPMLAAREAQHPANPVLDQIDGIILLGGAERPAVSARWNRPELNEAADRVIAVATLARRFPGVPVLVTGGHGAPPTPSEAAISAAILRDLGLDPARLILEQRARNTAENARLGLARVRPAPGARWILVTSAGHMPRALAEFRAAGWPAPIPYPVDYRSTGWADATGWHPYRNMAQLHAALHEIVGQLAAHMTD